MTENEELTNRVCQLKRLRTQAENTVNPFQKAKIAEAAVGHAVDIIEVLVSRETSRGEG